MKHILIVGRQGVGKSTLVGRILAELGLPVYGFVTKKEAQSEDGASPVYIHAATGERHYSSDNLIGLCRDFKATGFDEVFNAHTKLITEAGKDGVLLMDELGVMERNAQGFCSAVLTALDTHPLIVASVRDKSCEFLDSVRTHKNARCFYLTKDNRDEVLAEILEHIKGQER